MRLATWTSCQLRQGSSRFPRSKRTGSHKGRREIAVCFLVGFCQFALPSPVPSGRTSVPASGLELAGQPPGGVADVLDGSAVQEASQTQLGTGGRARAVVFEDAFGGTAEAAGAYAARHPRRAACSTEVRGRVPWLPAPMPSLAGKANTASAAASRSTASAAPGRRRGRVLPAELAVRWRGDDSHSGRWPRSAPAAATSRAARSTGAAARQASWQPNQRRALHRLAPRSSGQRLQRLLLRRHPGTRPLTLRRLLLSDADPHKLGVLTP